MKVKTRFAPSPTGFLHIGGLRTALYNFLFAKKYGGTFLLRIEDTDRSRYVEGSSESLIETLKRVGITYDEGPFLQSQRLEIYQQHAQQLLDAGHAYRCFCTKERLEMLRKEQEALKQPTKYDRRCLGLSTGHVEELLKGGESHVVRLHIPDGETTFTDEIRGSITIPNAEVDDQVLLKSDGFPTYHLAVVVDDHLMGVTHVIRGEEWISSAPKHVILYHALGFPLPAFAHLPLILNPDKSKLSKRQGDVAVEDYLDKGYVPEALLNYVALLGFNPSGDREIYSIDELTAAFDLTRINKSGAVFDLTKLNWMNAHYLRNLPIERVLAQATPFLGAVGEGMAPEALRRAITVERSRATTLADLAPALTGYVTAPTYDARLLVWKKADDADAKQHLASIIDFLRGIDEDIFEQVALIEQAVKGYIESHGFQTGNVLWPMRVALSGSAQSASPFEIAWVLGKDQTIARLTQALQRIT